MTIFKRANQISRAQNRINRRADEFSRAQSGF
jgi:hypothetical protein